MMFANMPILGQQKIRLALARSIILLASWKNGYHKHVEILVYFVVFASTRFQAFVKSSKSQARLESCLIAHPQAPSFLEGSNLVCDLTVVSEESFRWPRAWDGVAQTPVLRNIDVNYGWILCYCTPRFACIALVYHKIDFVKTLAWWSCSIYAHGIFTCYMIWGTHCEQCIMAMVLYLDVNLFSNVCWLYMMDTRFWNDKVEEDK